MSNPNISVKELNTLLIPTIFYKKSVAQQDAILRTNSVARTYLHNLYYTLMYRANRKNASRTLSRLKLLKTNGKQIGLSANQQINLYFYFNSQQQSGLSRLVKKARIIEQQIKLYRSRSVNNPT